MVEDLLPQMTSVEIDRRDIKVTTRKTGFAWRARKPA